MIQAYPLDSFSPKLDLDEIIPAQGICEIGLKQGFSPTCCQTDISHCHKVFFKLWFDQPGNGFPGAVACITMLRVVIFGSLFPCSLSG